LILHFILAMALAGLPADTSQPKEYVAALPAPHVTVAAGKPQSIKLRFRVSDGFHINSNLPHSAYLIPTKLSLSPPTDIGIGKITYPLGKDIALPFAPDEKLNVYSGEFAIAANVSSLRAATPGQYKVHGELSYQACNDRACFPPKKLPVSFDVTVTKSRVAAEVSQPGRKPARTPLAN
jgi:hypothetical protein